MPTDFFNTSMTSSFSSSFLRNARFSASNSRNLCMYAVDIFDEDDWAGVNNIFHMYDHSFPLRCKAPKGMKRKGL